MRIKYYLFCNLFFLALLLIVIYPGSLLAESKIPSPEEILKIDEVTKEKVNSSEVQRWVQQIKNQTNSYSKSPENLSVNDNQRRSMIMILVSSSVPIQSLRQYLIDMSKLNKINALNKAGKNSVTLVMRGFFNNSVPATAQYIHTALNGMQGGFEIDPIVFEKLNITKVPAIIFFNHNGIACLNQTDCIPDGDDMDIIYGNISLSYALEKIAEQGVNKKAAKNTLLQLEEASYG